mgnify:CR=1 FL=1
MSRHGTALGWTWPLLFPAPLTSPPPVVSGDGGVDVAAWMAAEGIPPDSMVDLGALPNREMPAALRKCDAAVFPSRAEGATNLVAMEAIACGVPTLLSANTGHLDLLKDVPAVKLSQQASVPSLHATDGTEGWGESDVEEIVHRLERVHQDWNTSRKQARLAAEAIESRSWQRRTAALQEDCFSPS